MQNSVGTYEEHEIILYTLQVDTTVRCTAKINVLRKPTIAINLKITELSCSEMFRLKF